MMRFVTLTSCAANNLAGPGKKLCSKSRSQALMELLRMESPQHVNPEFRSEVSYESSPRYARSGGVHVQA
jgi:hypothetical protein